MCSRACTLIHLQHTYIFISKCVSRYIGRSNSVNKCWKRVALGRGHQDAETIDAACQAHANFYPSPTVVYYHYMYFFLSSFFFFSPPLLSNPPCCKPVQPTTTHLNLTLLLTLPLPTRILHPSPLAHL